MGFWKFTWEVTKTITKTVVVGTAATALTAATGGLGALVVGGVLIGEGLVVKSIAEDCDNEFFQKVGGFVQDVGLDTFTGGAFGVLSESTKVGAKAAEVIKAAEKAEREFNRFKASYPPGVNPMSLYHDWHKSEGKNYDSDCVVCRSSL